MTELGKFSHVLHEIMESIQDDPLQFLIPKVEKVFTVLHLIMLEAEVVLAEVTEKKQFMLM